MEIFEEILRIVFLFSSGFVPFVLFCSQLKRRKFFWLRLIAAIAVFAVFRFLSEYFGIYKILYVNSAYNIALFVVMTFMMWFCFSEKYFTVLFCCVAGKSTMHMTEYVSSLLILLINKPIIYLSIVIYTLVYTAVYFLFARRIKRDECAGISNLRIILFGCITLFITDFLMMVFTEQRADKTVKIIFYVLIPLLCFVILCMLFGLLTESKIKREAETIRQLRSKEREQYEISRETINLIGIKHHDIQALLNSRGKLSEEEIRVLRESLEACDISFNTGNKTLDVVLTEKFISCRRLGIRLECLANGSSLDFMNELDIYSLFLNALNNAAESVEKIQDEKKRVIWLNVNNHGNMVFIQIQNYFAEKPVILPGYQIATTKEEKQYHGYGMSSMKMIAQKYGGTLSARADNEIFSLGVVIPIP